MIRWTCSLQPQDFGSMMRVLEENRVPREQALISTTSITRELGNSRLPASLQTCRTRNCRQELPWHFTKSTGCKFKNHWARRALMLFIALPSSDSTPKRNDIDHSPEFVTRLLTSPNPHNTYKADSYYPHF